MGNLLEKEAIIYIQGVKTRYVVRTDGKVFSMDYRGSGKIHELSKVTDTGGYQEVNLSLDGKHMLVQVHQLVAQAFIPNPNSYDEVNHIDGDKINNHVTNLEWCTRSGNIHHAYVTGLIKSRCGEDHERANITNDQARKICELLEQNVGMKTISKTLNISYETVNRIYHRNGWKSISKDYNFDNYNADEHKKLTDNQVHEMCQMYMNDPSLNFTKIGKIYNLNKATVRNILRGYAYKDIVSQYDLTR